MQQPYDIVIVPKCAPLPNGGFKFSVLLRVYVSSEICTFFSNRSGPSFYVSNEILHANWGTSTSGGTMRYIDTVFPAQGVAKEPLVQLVKVSARLQLMVLEDVCYLYTKESQTVSDGWAKWFDVPSKLRKLVLGREMKPGTALWYSEELVPGEERTGSSTMTDCCPSHADPSIPDAYLVSLDKESKGRVVHCDRIGIKDLDYVRAEDVA